MRDEEPVVEDRSVVEEESVVVEEVSVAVERSGTDVGVMVGDRSGVAARPCATCWKGWSYKGHSAALACRMVLHCGIFCIAACSCMLLLPLLASHVDTSSDTV